MKQFFFYRPWSIPGHFVWEIDIFYLEKKNDISTVSVINFIMVQKQCTLIKVYQQNRDAFSMGNPEVLNHHETFEKPFYKYEGGFGLDSEKKI